jgi:NAD(P)-dependent dehydrogenase (short-subunit alcohol dehydrogenase family)
MNPTYDFTGQVALVTGASSGMGLATAQAFAHAGAAVVLADINDEALQAATTQLRAGGYEALGIRCDVSDEQQVAALIDQTVTAYGRLDMAFNNAGIQTPPSDAADEPADTFDRVNAVNLRGVWACMKHELRQMREQGSGAIVTAPHWAGSSASPDAPRTTRPNTACSGSPAARPWSTRRAGSGSTPSVPAPSRPRWSPP